MNTDLDQYFVIQLSLKPKIIVGPISLNEINKSVAAGTFRLSDIIWNSQTKDGWLRLYQMSEVLQNLSAIPELLKLKEYEERCLESLLEVEPAAASPAPTQFESATENTQQTSLQSATPKEMISPFPPPIPPFYLQSFGKEYGPLSEDALQKILNAGDFKSFIYVWYNGLETWVPISEIPNLRRFLPEKSMLLQVRSERFFVIFTRETRSYNRIKLVAACKARVTDDRFEPFGVCADISKTGAQIWLEGPFTRTVGETLDIEFIPLSATRVPIITVKGRIIWYLEKESRLGVSFVDFYGSGKIILQNYIDKSEGAKSCQFT